MSEGQQKRSWNQNRRVVLAATILIFGGFTMVMPFLPFYLQELGIRDVASNAAWSGIILSIAPLAAALTGPFWGWLADRYGLKPMALRVMLAFTVGWLIFGLATHLSHLLVARIIGGVFGGFNSLTIPLITAGCPRQALSRAIGTVQSTRIASIALGPLAGGLLSNLIGVRNTAFVTAGLCVIAFLLFMFFYSPYEEPEKAEEPARLRLADLVRLPFLLPLFASLFLTSFVDRGLGPIIPLMVLELGSPPSDAAGISGLIFSAGALASTLSAWGVGRLAARRHPVYLLRLMAVSSTIIFVPLTLCSSNLQLGVYRLLLGFTMGGILTLSYVIGNFWIPSSSAASGMAVLTSGSLLGYGMGPLVVGALASFGLRIALGAGLPVFLLLVWVTWKKIPLSLNSVEGNG